MAHSICVLFLFRFVNTALVSDSGRQILFYREAVIFLFSFLAESELGFGGCEHLRYKKSEKTVFPGDVLVVKVSLAAFIHEARLRFNFSIYRVLIYGQWDPPQKNQTPKNNY